MRSLQQGITPRKLAITCALGVVLGLFPVFGVTTLLCLAAAMIFRLNIPIIQLVNYLAAPLQLLLIVPFIKLGAFMLRLKPFPYSADELMVMFRDDHWTVLQELGLAIVIGIGVWTVFSVPMFFLLFFPGLWIFRRWRSPDQRELKSQ